MFPYCWVLGVICIFWKKKIFFGIHMSSCSRYHLLKTFSLLHWISFVPLSKMSWLHLGRSDSQAEESSLYSLSSKSFHYEKVLDFVKCLFCIKWDDYVGFFPSFYGYLVLHWFSYIEQLLHFWVKFHLATVNNYYMLLDSIS